MSKPVFSDLLNFSGRRNRKSFILFTLFSLAVVVGLWFGIGAIAGQDEPPLLLVLAGGLVTAALMVMDVAVSVQRVHDFGWPGWVVLVTLLPVVGWVCDLALACIPGTRGPNRYGPDPLDPVVSRPD